MNVACVCLQPERIVSLSWKWLSYGFDHVTLLLKEGIYNWQNEIIAVPLISGCLSI